MKFIFHLLLMIALSALAGAAWLAHRAAIVPVNVTDGTAKPYDLVDELKQSAMKGSGVLEVSEADLNRHFAKVIQTKIDPSLARWVRFENLHLQLEPDLARLILVWVVAGEGRTVTVNLKVARLDKVFRVEVVGGAYGHLDVPRGLMRPVSPALLRISKLFQDELQALFQMNQIRVAKGKLVLDPRFL